MQRTLVTETLEQVGKKVKIQGWADTVRDHGKVAFVDLRDRTGLVQVVLNKDILTQLEGHVSSEDVIEILGTVKERPENLVNKNIETGTIEIEATEITILNSSEAVPFPLNTDGHDINEEVRLKYRYVDLRRARMNKILKLRSQLYKSFRESMYKESFVEIETPMLTKSTKEGSRDFIVPSRFNPGKYYALPQSPQQYKQLLMTAGVERYFQMARCIRDEDLRADRGFEFTQLDLEMSFVERNDVMATVEEAVKYAMTQNGGVLKDTSFPVITYDEAMKKYGEDRFDIRTEKEKADGVLAFAWVVDFPFFKKVDTEDVAEVRDGKSGWTFTHNPFSQPKQEHLSDHLSGSNIEKIVTTQYDLVCNGYEVGGGSIRAHKPEVLKQTFALMGYSDEEIEASVGHMLKAFALGTPPHGGIALGLDRLVMLLAGEASLKETIAFPMTSTGKTAVMDAPAEVSQEQLAELGISSQTIDTTLTVTEQIKQKLSNLALKFKTIEHKSVLTSEEAAEVRGSSLSAGAKALVMKADGQLVMVVVPGDKKADLKAIKQFLGQKDLSMAPKDVVEEITKVQIGGIPPFGSLFNLSTYVDASLSENKIIFFNAGSREVSISMAYNDYIISEQPTIGVFAK